MTDTQFKELMAKLDEIERNTNSSKDGGYNTEDIASDMNTIIKLLKALLKTKGIEF